MTRDGPDPLGLDDVLEIIREAQEQELATLEATLVDETEREAEAARIERLHRARIHALDPIVEVFRDTMRRAGNPGLERYGGSWPGDPVSARAGVGRVPRLSFWPLASAKFAEPTNWSSSRPVVCRFIGLTVKGEWWEGTSGNEYNDPPTWATGSYRPSRRVTLADLADPAGFGAIEGHRESVSIDLAIVETMALLTDQHELDLVRALRPLIDRSE
jgi:hypothetical protein